MSTEIRLVDDLIDPRGDARNQWNILTSAHFRTARYTKQEAKSWVLKIVLFGKSASYKREAAKYRDLCNNYCFVFIFFSLSEKNE